MSDTNEDFTSGYSDDETTTVTPALEVIEKPEEAAPEVEYAQITKSDYESIQAKLAEFETLKAEQSSKFDKAFGALGGLKQSIESFRNQTTGQIEISPEDFEELRANYPEVADDQIKGLQRVLSKMKGGAPDPEYVERLVQERLPPELQKIRSEFEGKLIEIQLESAHSDWRDVVTKKEFTDWMDKEGLTDSNDPKVVSSYITKFKNATKKEVKEEKPSSRQQRFSAAVTPKGSGANPTPNKSEHDDFLSGYADD